MIGLAARLDPAEIRDLESRPPQELTQWQRCKIRLARRTRREEQFKATA